MSKKKAVSTKAGTLSKAARGVKPTVKATPEPEPTVAQRVIALPRMVRIGMISMFALTLVAALFPLVDHLYLILFYSPQTTLLPSLVSALAGVAMFVLGWVLIVGWAGEQPPARPVVMWYFIGGVFIIIFVAFLMLYGMFTGSATS